MRSSMNKSCKRCSYSATCLVDGRLRTLARVWKSLEEAMTAGLLPCELDDFGAADENLRRATQHARARLQGDWSRRLTRQEFDEIAKASILE